MLCALNGRQATKRRWTLCMQNFMPQETGAKSEEARNSEVEIMGEDYLFFQRINVE
jgi:hypothetical protein